MKYDISEAYSLMYGKILTAAYRRVFLDWIRTNHPNALARIVKDQQPVFDALSPQNRSPRS